MDGFRHILSAITPDIQVSAREQRQEQMRVDEAREAAQIATVAMETETVAVVLPMKQKRKHSLRTNARNVIPSRMLKTIHHVLKRRQPRSLLG